MKEQVFRYCKGEENVVVVEKSNYTESLFREQYMQALQLVIDHLEHPKDSVPNLVAFCGDRGEGKTSCMMTVCHIIENSNNTTVINDVKALGVDVERLKGADFNVLPIIDPAFFDKEHNIIELLLGHIYKLFKDWRKDHDAEGYYSIANEVSKQFQNAKACLMHIGKSKVEMYDPLEELEVLSAGVELSNCISLLMEKYLQLIGKKKLLICIDDIDLNMSRAYRMSEEIRKYLNNKHCLILMSVKVDQLIDAIENSIHNDANFPDTMDFGGMASKYVDKLIPVPVRVNMPHAYDLCDYRLEVYERRTDGAELIFPSSSVKSGVVRKIFATSRFLFYNSKGSVSMIVPNNLRSLAQLLGLLFSMRDIDQVKQEDATEVFENNKNLFKSYFYKSWVKQLNRDNQLFVTDLTIRQDGNDLNKYVVNHLAKCIKDHNIEGEQIKNIVNSSNYGYNISVGDVLNLVSYLEQSSFDEELNKLLFFIKSFYSIRLYEKYDAVTNNISVELYPESESKGSLYRADALFEHTNVLQRFVSGSYFTYTPNDLIAPIQIKQNKEATQSRDYGIVNGIGGRGLNDLLMVLGKIFRDGDFDTMSEEQRNLFQLKFRMAEYFILTISRNVLKRDIRETKSGVVLPSLDRKAAVPSYLTSFNSNMGYYVFDVLAPFYSMTNPQYAYARFKDIADLYGIAINNEWSLLREMMKVVRQKEINDLKIPAEDAESYKPIDEHNIDYWKWRLMSNSVIRNTEVALALMENCRHNRSKNRDSAVSRELLAAFYKSISESNMVTYNRGENEEPYFIDFDFLSPIITLLSDNRIDNETELKGKVLPSFDQIFVYEVKKKAGNSDSEDTQMAQNFFSLSLEKYKTMMGSSVINRIRNRQPELYKMVEASIWREWFDVNDLYTKEQVLQILQEHITEFEIENSSEDQE